MNSLALGLFALGSIALAPAPSSFGPLARNAQEPGAAELEVSLAEVRELLEAARRAQAEGDHAGASERILAAIERGFADIGDRADAGASALFAQLGQFAHAAGLLRAAERVGRAVLEVRARTLPADHRDLQEARLSLGSTLYALGELHEARALEEAVIEVRARTLPPDHRDLARARLGLATTMAGLGDLHGARALFEAVLEVFARTLPPDHEDVLTVRLNLAQAMKALGDLHGARALQESVLEARTRTLPPDHPELQVTKRQLAATMRALGDLHGARALQEDVLEVSLRTLPPDYQDLQGARQGLAVTLHVLGDLHGARALQESVLEVQERTLPPDHPDLQGAQLDLGTTLQALGDLHGARALFEAVLEVRSRTLPRDHPDLQALRGNLAVTMAVLGDLSGARALQQAVVEVDARTLPADHPDLQSARMNLAMTMYALGDLHGARSIAKAVLEVQSRTLPRDHPDLQTTQGNLAMTMKALGDFPGARALEEAVLEVFARTLPEDHPDLQLARSHLAATLSHLGDLSGARALEETVLEVFARTLPPDHPHLQTARLHLARTMHALGDLRGARSLEEAALDVFARTLPEDHPYLQGARQDLARTMQALGDLPGAYALFEAVLEVQARTLPSEHPDLQTARGNLALAIMQQFGPEEARCAELVGALCQSQVSAARAALLTSSLREAEERCALLAQSLDTTLSTAGADGAFDPLGELERGSFVLSEMTRGAALASASILHRAAGAPDYVGLRGELGEASKALAALAQKGCTSEEFHRARMRREEAERDLVALAREWVGDEIAVLDFDVEAVEARLGARDAVVGFRRYTRWSLEAGPAPENAEDRREDALAEADATDDAATEWRSVESLCAFVVQGEDREPAGTASGTSLAIVELGAIDPIDEAVRAWRGAIGAGIERGFRASGALAGEERRRGDALRRLVWDPVALELGDADQVIVALEDVLHLVPLEALPVGTEDGGAERELFVGDRWRIETRVTLSELLGERPACDRGGAVDGGVLVALGGASFNSEPVELAAADLAALQSDDPWNGDAAGILRGGAWERGFSPLTYTGLEAREIAALFDEVFAGEGAALVLEKRKASRAALEELAPRARFLHVATHGWFAPESIVSWSDAGPLDARSGLSMRPTGEELVRGMSPMLLCGLALAGANLPENEVGRVPGLVTAEELSTLDLSSCELAVLSACDTNVGERRAGQGVAGLQKALQMAGARSVITSLWKVPDEATRELMLDFYRRIWVEKKPKAQALWEAKQKLRAARDERGEPLYTTRDWAAWVLTGEPD